MDNNEEAFQISNQEKKDEKNEFELNEALLQNIGNSVPQNMPNSNQSNLQNNNDKELDEQDGTDNLRFKDNNYNNYNFYIQQRLDSYDSTPAQYKFSIDLPNVPKQRLHEYLNDDLLNAIEVSPNKNTGIANNNKLSLSNENPSDNKQNNPNNLYGFSLYPQSNDNNNNNLNNQEIQNINNNVNSGNNININNNFNNVYNYNNFQNYNFLNNHYTNLKYNINNPQVYVPTKFRNKDQIYNKEIIISGQKNHQNNNYQNQKKEEQNNAKNKYDNNKKNNQNFKKEGKNKKHFEIRAGDWTCSKCNNLNFSFRNKCNRCGLPKELNNKKNEQMNPEIFGQNMNYQIMNGINSNFFYGNNNVSNINNVNNSNNVKFYPK